MPALFRWELNPITPATKRRFPSPSGEGKAASRVSRSYYLLATTAPR